jgi:hypothetical protein
VQCVESDSVHIRRQVTESESQLWVVGNCWETIHPKEVIHMLLVPGQGSDVLMARKLR